jgi:hypothetical protein
MGGGAFQGNAGLSLGEQMRAPSSSIAPSGTATEIADLFEYSIANPGHRKEKRIGHAAVPAAEDRGAQTDHLFRRHKTNPLSAAELTNNTGRTLDGGPITVYDAGAYAGEALVETIKNSDKRFISYGVDLGTRISTNAGFPQRQRSRNPRSRRHARHALCHGPEENLCGPQCGPARQNPDHRIPGAARLQADRHRAAHGNRPRRLPLRSQSPGQRRRRFPGDRRKTSTTRQTSVSQSDARFAARSTSATKRSPTPRAASSSRSPI